MGLYFRKERIRGYSCRMERITEGILEEKSGLWLSMQKGENKRRVFMVDGEYNEGIHAERRQ